MENTGKTDVVRGAKGIITNNPYDTAQGFMGGEPSAPDKFIAESKKLQEADPGSISSKIKKHIISAIKTPTTLLKSGLEVGHGTLKWGSLQVNKAVQQTRNLIAIALAIPVKAWEVASTPPKWAIQKITDTTHKSIEKVINLLPSNPPRQS